MMTHSFLNASVIDIVAQLRVEEKIALLSAPNWWNTTSIPRLGIPSIRMSDGPNGVRGSSHFVSTPAQCIPCATSLASTFDKDLVREVGILLGKEAKIKSSVVLLAPTCNIQRSPLGGRSFESFSEDPYLSGTLAAAYINGLQSEGVSATIKHLVANDQEHERTAADSVMSDRALREIYLYPFMLAQKHAEPGAYMTSYGRIKGVHCSENTALLTDIIRNEWNFGGIIMSDWFGTYGVDGALNAGLDLEMPGPPRWRTLPLVLQCLSAQKLFLQTLDQRVINVLTFVQQLARKSPEVVYGDGIERSRDSPETREFCRRLAAEGIVLLKNMNDLLPLTSDSPFKLAIIGPNAKERIISGGGSAALKPTYVVTPWEGILTAAPSEWEILYHVGCYAHKYLPTLEKYLVTPAGEPGWLCSFYNHDENGGLGPIVANYTLVDTRVKLNDFLPDGLTPTWSIKLEGKLKIEKSVPFEFGLTVAGRAKLWINGKLVIDNWTKQTAGDFFYGQGTVEEKATIDMTAWEPVDVLVEYTNSTPADDDANGPSRLAQPALMRGVRLGGCEKIDPEEAIEAAVSLAEEVNAVVIISGLSPEWESEGFDRPTLQLPGRQDELISRVSKANINTVVCIQAGSAVSMPWIDNVSGLLYAWYSGNEAGNAIADVLFGIINPSGRLPLTFPARLEDTPAFLNHRCEQGKIHYREDLLVGYKHYQARSIKPLFPFGWGLSYTTFSLSDLSVSEPVFLDVSLDVKVSVTVQNEGLRTGSETVQFYISFPTDISLAVPKYQLKGFAKVRNVEPGSSRRVKIELDRLAFSVWDEKMNSWHVVAGTYTLHTGNNSDDLPLSQSIQINKSFGWRGL